MHDFKPVLMLATVIAVIPFGCSRSMADLVTIPVTISTPDPNNFSYFSAAPFPVELGTLQAVTLSFHFGGMTGGEFGNVFEEHFVNIGYHSPSLPDEPIFVAGVTEPWEYAMPGFDDDYHWHSFEVSTTHEFNSFDALTLFTAVPVDYHVQYMDAIGSHFHGVEPYTGLDWVTGYFTYIPVAIPEARSWLTMGIVTVGVAVTALVRRRGEAIGHTLA